MATGGAGLRT